jgi:hypothetical protein
METLGDKIMPKLCSKFFCKSCDYYTSKKSSFNNHLLSAKHKKSIIGDALVTLNDEIMPKICHANYTCDNCNKSYDSRNGLWKHSKICNINIINNNINSINSNNDVTITSKTEDIAVLTDIMKYLMKENSEMKSLMIEQQKQQNMMIEVVKNGTQNTNCNNTTNSHNKAFNLNFFLNETCKEAMNIGEFVDSLKIQLSDLENIGEAGYIEGISNIIVKNLKALDITKRPVHCTDKKRETVYIKDADKWEKDEDKTHMHKLIKRVVSKNVKMFSKFKEVHPDCLTYHSKFSEQYNKIVYESMGGKGDDDTLKNEKIIKNVLKEVVVDKNI